MAFIYWAFILRLSMAIELAAAGGAMVNVALHKPAKFVEQRDYDPDPYAARAVDGNDSPNMNKDKSCVNTQSKTNNWWAVDLLFIYDIYDLRIGNRDYLKNRLKKFYIYVSVEDPFPISNNVTTFKGNQCLFYNGDTLPPYLSPIQCDQPTRGRYVYLFKPGTDSLTFCEFEVLVPEEKKPMELIWTLGRISGVLPVYQPIVRSSSPLECIAVCLLHSPRTPTHVQMSEKTGECQCIQYSPILTQPGSWTIDGDFQTYARVDDVPQ